MLAIVDLPIAAIVGMMLGGFVIAPLLKCEPMQAVIPTGIVIGIILVCCALTGKQETHAYDIPGQNDHANVN